MKWLSPDEERFVRRMRAGPGSSFGRGDRAIVDELFKRGILSMNTVRCPDCGMHDTTKITLTPRGKIVFMLLDVVHRNPVM